MAQQASLKLQAFKYYYAAAGATGVAPTEYLDKMLAEPFERFTFSPAGAAV